MRLTGNAILLIASAVKIAEIAICALGRHLSAEFPTFLTRAHPVELGSIQGVDISDNISHIIMSHDRIPQIKKATSMLKVVETLDCYYDEKEVIVTELTTFVNLKTLTQD